MDNNPEGTAKFLVFMAVVIGGGGYLLRRRKNRRFIIDEHGERQRVISWNRGQPVYDPKTWQQRIHEEAIARTKRRLTLLWSGPLLAALVYGWMWLGPWGFIGLITVTGPLAFFTLWIGYIAVKALLLELIYQSGYQGMVGAKVLDKKPKRPGVELVETQMAHGDARLAGEAEAIALLKSNR